MGKQNRKVGRETESRGHSHGAGQQGCGNEIGAHGGQMKDRPDVLFQRSMDNFY